MKRWAWLFPALALAPVWACQGEEEKGSEPDRSPRVRRAGEPRRVLIERILISYRGNPFDINARRSLDEARSLAERVHERARKGENFIKLRDGYSDDRPAGSKAANGPYVLLNYDTPPAPTLPHLPRMERMSMGRRLGDRAFRMRDGEIALVEYHSVDYPAGYEILLCVKRDDRTEAQVAEDLKRKNK